MCMIAFERRFPPNWWGGPCKTGLTGFRCRALCHGHLALVSVVFTRSGHWGIERAEGVEAEVEVLGRSCSRRELGLGEKDERKT